ncbi:MAG TPA: lytic transglycosylase domain-containing protein, partial [Gaiellaceae bacterium]|nr:lytic transglycosylase domain-containing protein [Gaiellaceae bacterium]
PNLVRAVIGQESGFDASASSAAGAAGLMQLMPATAQSLGVTNPYDPTQAIDGGTRYLKSLLDRFGGDNRLALAAYNAGPGSVTHYGDVPPYPETQSYVTNVLGRYAQLTNERNT